jgi:hypothetical protein
MRRDLLLTNLQPQPPPWRRRAVVERRRILENEHTANEEINRRALGKRGSRANRERKDRSTATTWNPTLQNTVWEEILEKEKEIHKEIHYGLGH